jgi:hypothetical protein
MSPDDRGGADPRRRHPRLAKATGRHPTPWHRRGHAAWAWRFDHPFSGGGLRAPERRLRSRRADPAPAQLRGGRSLASAVLVGCAGGHSLARAGGRRPRRPGGDLHALARLGAQTRPTRRSARARAHRSRGATTSARAATAGPARRPATAATATPSASTRSTPTRSGARRRQARPRGPHPGRSRADRHLRALAKLVQSAAATTGLGRGQNRPCWARRSTWVRAPPSGSRTGGAAVSGSGSSFAGNSGSPGPPLAPSPWVRCQAPAKTVGR